jgi:nucleotide-binding universal stress UspA family protein
VTLLTAIDDSAMAQRVLAHAVAFSNATGLNLHVVRVIDPKLDLVEGADPSDELIASVAATWEEDLVTRLQQAGGAGNVSAPAVRPGERVHQTIARIAQDNNARTIVIGSHGASLLRHTVLGSVAMGVVGNAPCPVLVIGPRASEIPDTGNGYTTMVADDGSQASRAIIDAMQPLLRAARLRLKLVHLYEPRLGDEGERAETQRAMEALLTEREALPDPDLASCEVRTLPDFERVDAALLRVAQELGVQAIAMATRGYSARRHILAGSVAVGVLKHAELPVLLVRRP